MPQTRRSNYDNAAEENCAYENLDAEEDLRGGTRASRRIRDSEADGSGRRPLDLKSAGHGEEESEQHYLGARND